MRFLTFAITFALVVSLSHPAEASDHKISASLLSDRARPNPGDTIRLAIHMKPLPGWHGYWQNPGDSGLAPHVRWNLPEGAKVGDLEHPAPTVLEMAGLVSYIYDGNFALLADLEVPETATPGEPFPISAIIQYAACSDQVCRPERTNLELVLRVGSGRETPARSALFRVFEQALPQSHPAKGELSQTPDGVELSIPAPPAISATSARLFPITKNLYPAAEKVQVRKEGQRLIFTLPISAQELPSRFDAVIDSGRGSRAHQITALPVFNEPAQSEAPEKTLTSKNEPTGIIKLPDAQPTHSNSAGYKGPTGVITAVASAKTEEHPDRDVTWLVALIAFLLIGFVFALVQLRTPAAPKNDGGSQ